MITAKTNRLTGLLEATGLFKPEQVETVLAAQQEAGSSVTAAVVKSGFANEQDFLAALGKAMGLPYKRMRDATIEKTVLEKLPTKAVFQYNVFPVDIENGALRVATNDPFDPGLVDALRLASGMRVRLVLSPGDRHQRRGQEVLRRRRRHAGADGRDDRIEVAPEDDLLPSRTSDELDQEASVVKFVNQIIWEAYQDRATDIHLEPMETDLRIRYRIDGVLHQTPVPPQLKRFQAAIISRIKVMANMDIAEKRLPQDGRISLRIRGEEIDVRVSTMPTVYGESVSLRLLHAAAAACWAWTSWAWTPRTREILQQADPPARTASCWSPARPGPASPPRSTPGCTRSTPSTSASSPSRTRSSTRWRG